MPIADTKTKTLDQQLHDLDEAGKLYEYAETVLGCSAEQADVLSRTMRHLFEWSGVRLIYRSENGEKLVAVDHADQVRERLTRQKLDFLLPAPKAAVEGFADISIPEDLLDAALTSKTAEGRICMEYMGGNTKDAAAKTALLIRAHRAKRNGTINDANDTNKHGVTDAERRTNSTNPFLKLSMARNAAEKEAATTAISSLIRAVGTTKATAIARSANLTLTGQPLRG